MIDIINFLDDLVSVFSSENTDTLDGESDGLLMRDKELDEIIEAFLLEMFVDELYLSVSGFGPLGGHDQGVGG